MTSPNSLEDLWQDLGAQLQLLAVSGGAGAAFRTLIHPEKRWKRRVVQSVAGAFSAMFLGGVLASIIDALTHAGAYAYLAAGFIMGSGGELAVKAIQDRFLGAKDDD